MLPKAHVSRNFSDQQHINS